MARNRRSAEFVHAHNLLVAIILDFVRIDRRFASCIRLTVWYNGPGFPQASETRTSRTSVSARKNVQPLMRRVLCCQIQGAEDGATGADTRRRSGDPRVTGHPQDARARWENWRASCLVWSGTP